MRAWVVAMALVVALGGRAHAGQPVRPLAALDATGTAAVAWTITGARGRTAALRVALGRPGDLTVAATVPFGDVTSAPVLQPLVALAATPDGGARVVWVERRLGDGSDVPGPTWVLRTVAVTADGAAGAPVELATGSTLQWASAGNERGDLLLAWRERGAAAVTLVDMPAGGDVSPSPSPLGAAVSVAVGLADDGTAVVGGDGAVALRPLGGAFGPPLATGQATVDAVDVAADGTVAASGAQTVAVRPPGGAFGSPVATGQALRVFAFRGGGALYTTSAGDERLFDISPDGAVLPRAVSLYYDNLGDVAAREDGSAAAGTFRGGLYARDGVGPFARAPDRVPVDPSLAVSAAGILAAGTSDAGIEAAGQVLDRPSRPRRGWPFVVPRRVTARGRWARVPVRCRVACRGTLRAGDGPAVRLRLRRGDGAVLRVRVPARATRARLTVELRGLGRFRLVRRLRRGGS